ncbi:MAG: DUF3592 domain-containing protein [Chlamydiota bacterium]|nr:DUF3592 domain-containing protein [Chlamydiota bacterium]
MKNLLFSTIKRLFSGFGLILCVGVFFFYQGLYCLYFGIRSVHWPETSATVFQSERIEYEGGVKPNSFVYKFAYEYSVNHKTYQSHRYHYKPSSLFHGANRHRAGDVITIHYDPLKPARATVIAGYTWYVLLWIFIGMVVLVFLIGVLIPEGKGIRRDSSSLS